MTKRFFFCINKSKGINFLTNQNSLSIDFRVLNHWLMENETGKITKNKLVKIM